MLRLRLIFTFICLFSFSLLFAQSPTKAFSDDTILPLDSTVCSGKLGNGLTYYIRHNGEPSKRAELYLVLKAGSILEEDNQLGLAHFAEHMSFNGTKHFPKNELINYLQKSGVRFGADVNASTNFDETIYNLSIPTDDKILFQNGIQILRDWAQDATLDSIEIEKERGVILEEMRLGKGAEQRLAAKYLPIMFNNSKYANRLAIGKEDIIKNFEPATLRQFYKNWYRPDLEAVIIVGDIDIKSVEKIIKAKFGDLKNPTNEQPRIKYAVPLTGKNQFISVTDKEFPYTGFYSINKGPIQQIKTLADYKRNLLFSFFNGMLGDRLSETSERANPPFLQGESYFGSFLPGTSGYNTFIMAKPGELERGLKTVWTEIERVKRFGFTQTELDRVKELTLTRTQSTLKEKGKNPSMYLAFLCQYHFLTGNATVSTEMELELEKQLFPGIALSNVNKLAQEYITDMDRDFIVMGPDKDKANLPDITTVNKWIADVKGDKLTAYINKVSDKPLLATKPTRGKVIKENKIAKLNVTELFLDNGVKVTLKPTNFKNDEIVFTAMSPGGTSIYDDEDYESAFRSADIVNGCGIGGFDQSQLTKVLNGKNLYVYPFIGERREGLYGSSSTEDIETAMQLIYMLFTQPRMDPDIFSKKIVEEKAAIANRENDPASVFKDTMNLILGNYNIRRRGPSIDRIDQVRENRVFEIYKERFANAGDFNFVFAGNFDVDSIKVLVEQYIGSLPAKGVKEQAVDRGIAFPMGEFKKIVYKGKENKATVNLVFSDDYNYNDENNLLLDALGEIVHIKLVERLRELESGVYSPGVRVVYNKYPHSSYSFTISFGCAPENVDKLIKATMDEIYQIRLKGPQRADVEKFIAEETRSAETQQRDNWYWVDNIQKCIANGEEISKLLDYIPRLKKLTTDILISAAPAFINGNNLITFILMPEH